jgi:membrane protease YdiL (CAAX protease family)
MTSLPVGVVVSSLGFMAHHIILLGTYWGWSSSLTWILSLAVAMGGAVWAWMYERFESVIPVWISHLLVDAGVFLIGYGLVRESL